VPGYEITYYHFRYSCIKSITTPLTLMHEFLCTLYIKPMWEHGFLLCRRLMKIDFINNLRNEIENVPLPQFIMVFLLSFERMEMRLKTFGGVLE
jgi:hypothetical protein